MGVALAGCFSSVTDNPEPGEDPGECTENCNTPAEDVIPAPPFTNGASTLAGAAKAGMVDGNRDVARFDDPVTVAASADGKTTYVADFNNGRVRAVTADGTVTTALALDIFKRPFAIVVASPTTLYVGTDSDDQGQHSLQSGTVWEVDVSQQTASVIARDIGRPRGMALQADGRLVLSDNEHHVVRLLDPRTGALTVLAGTADAPGYSDESGMGARFTQPYGVAVRPDGKVVVADYGNNLIRLIEPTGQMHTLVGNTDPGFADGGRDEARFAHPQDVACDAAGNIYVSDSDNFVVRKIDKDGNVTTVAGDGNAGYRDDDNPLKARFYGLEGIDISADGKTLYVADGDRGEGVPYHRVRVVKLP